jgi:hypothetical protein
VTVVGHAVAFTALRFSVRFKRHKDDLETDDAHAKNGPAWGFFTGRGAANADQNAAFVAEVNLC